MIAERTKHRTNKQTFEVLSCSTIKHENTVFNVGISIQVQISEISTYWVGEDDDDRKFCWKVFVGKLKMFSIPSNSQMTTHTLPEGGHSGKWLKSEDKGSIMRIFTNEIEFFLKISLQIQNQYYWNTLQIEILWESNCS